MLFLKQPLILPFLYHKSATKCQIDSYKVSNSTLKPDLCKFAKTEMIESTAPPQQQNKRGTVLLGHILYYSKRLIKHNNSHTHYFKADPTNMEDNVATLASKISFNEVISHVALRSHQKLSVAVFQSFYHQ